MFEKKYKTEAQARKARNKSVQKYHTKSMEQFSFRFHKVSDKEVITKLKNVENRNDYIRQLILNDIKNNK